MPLKDPVGWLAACPLHRACLVSRENGAWTGVRAWPDGGHLLQSRAPCFGLGLTLVLRLPVRTLRSSVGLLTLAPWLYPLRSREPHTDSISSGAAAGVGSTQHLPSLALSCVTACDPCPCVSSLPAGTQTWSFGKRPGLRGRWTPRTSRWPVTRIQVRWPRCPPWGPTLPAWPPLL